MVLAGGRILPFNFGPISGADNTVSSPGAGYPTTGGGTGSGQTVGNTPSANAVNSNIPPVSYLIILFIIIGGLVLAKYLTEKGDKKDSYHLVGFSVYNVAAITVLAGLGITVAKIIANKWPLVPAVTDIVNMW